MLIGTKILLQGRDMRKSIPIKMVVPGIEIISDMKVYLGQNKLTYRW
jgi:hypothetical protein